MYNTTFIAIRLIARVDVVQQEIWLVYMLDLHWVMWSVYYPHGKYTQFDGIVYQQIVGIPMGTNCAPLIADLFLYCYERDFVSNLQKSKRFDLIDKFNDTSRYLDDIFTIDNPAFAEHISDIYPRELQLNKVNTSEKETSFLDLNITVIGNNIHTSVYDKRDDIGFPMVNFPWFEWWYS